MDQCKTCHQFYFAGRAHQCPPCWDAVRNERILDEDALGEIETVYAHDAEDAAIAYAKANHADWDYPSESEIWVRRGESEPWQKFTITVETEPVFTARNEEGRILR